MSAASEDPRLRAARYREGLDVETLAALEGRTLDPDAAKHVDPDSGGSPEENTPDEAPGEQRRLLANNVEVVARTAIDQAIAQGHFDHLAYAGKPLPDVVASTDPDWWTKSLMRREEVHATEGLGPEALLLRVVDQELDDQLDALRTPAEVAAAVEAFNSRVIEARRQLLGGPPVVTPTRDVGQEVQRWRARRDARAEAEHGRKTQEDSEPRRSKRRWFR